ncbi:MAG: HNH endonuclease [Deltaproteobacteria bacterium]|nr:HNH endonuclease [Deltaproteobacteria bacterium]
MRYQTSEVWVAIPYFPTYQISTLGRFCGPRGIKKLETTHRGYLRSCIYQGKRGKPKHVVIHRLVAEAFIPNSKHKPEVNHINCDKTDNRVENLEWVTRKENAAHARKFGCYSHGEQRYNHKLTEQTVREIRNAKNKTHQQLADDYGVAKPTITQVLTGRKWKHVTANG